MPQSVRDWWLDSDDHEIVDVFGVRGCKDSKNPGWWLVDQGSSELDSRVPARSIINSATMFGAVQEAAKRSSRKRRPAFIEVNAELGLTMILKGELSPEQLRRAAEGDGYRDVPGIIVNDRELTIRIIARRDSPTRILDAKGKVI